LEAAQPQASVGAGQAMKARIFVTLKDGVLDPQGQAIQGALGALGFDGVNSVRQGKVFDVELADAKDAEARLRAMCEKLLANTVIEDFRVDIVR
jgi:phosphoribosylformylglycinamidine synthase